MRQIRQPLPIDSRLAEIVSIMETDTNLVLQATPGSGKTTRVPVALLDAKFSRGKEIWVLEPRRLAAKFAARRVAEERGEDVGKTIGYQFRLERATSRDTRLLFLTEGMLIRRLLNDRALENVAAVVLDEFHERHIHGDIAFAYLRELQRTQRPDLRLIVMSATLDSAKIQAALDNCKVVSIETRQFPVDIRYAPLPRDTYLDQHIQREISRLLSDAKGDFLVFLPGMAEIRRAESALLASVAGKNAIVLPLHGEMDRNAQEMALKPSARRKIILATNVAETSLTIEGVSEVVDSGLHRMASFSWWSGVPALKTRAIAKASAIQRAGRAGRTAPGRCTRLYSQAEFEGRAPFDTPEIGRADLCQMVLELKAMGIKDPLSLPWLEAPPTTAIEAANDLLSRLGALKADGLLTETGKRLAEFPAHPRLGRMLIESESRNVTEPAARLAAMISEGRTLEGDVLEQARQRGDEFLERSKKQLLSSLEAGKESPSTWRESLARSVLVGFSDRVAQLRETEQTRSTPTERELVLSAGGSAKIASNAVQPGESLFVVLDIQELKGTHAMRSHLRARSVIGIEEDWLWELEPMQVGESADVSWDASRNRVVKRTLTTFGALVLDEKPGTPTPQEAASVLARQRLGPTWEKAELLTDWPEVLSPVAEKDAVENALARYELAAQHFPDKFDKLTPARIREAAAKLFVGRASMNDLKSLDAEAEISAALTGENNRTFESLVPSSIALLAGRKARVHYRFGKPPWVESRLQDFFGMKQGPTILQGRVPLTLHLLAPNHRAVQVTSDLAGFWQRSYPEVRKELSRKYPRHKWPEKP